MLTFLLLSLPPHLYLYPVPVSLSSLHVYSTTTSALLTWKLHRQQSLSSLSLYNTHSQSITHISSMKPSEAVKSQYTVTGLQPGTRFKVKVVVTTLLKQLNVTLKQRLSLRMETGIVYMLYCSLMIKNLKSDCKLIISVSSSVPSWLAGQWEKLLHPEKRRSDLEWSPPQLQTPGSRKSLGWPEDPRRCSLCIFSPAEPQQPAAAVDWTQWPAGKERYWGE